MMIKIDIIMISDHWSRQNTRTRIIAFWFIIIKSWLSLSMVGETINGIWIEYFSLCAICCFSTHSPNRGQGPAGENRFLGAVTSFNYTSPPSIRWDRKEIEPGETYPTSANFLKPQPIKKVSCRRSFVKLCHQDFANPWPTITGERVLQKG